MCIDLYPSQMILVLLQELEHQVCESVYTVQVKQNKCGSPVSKMDYTTCYIYDELYDVLYSLEIMPSPPPLFDD